MNEEDRLKQGVEVYGKTHGQVLGSLGDIDADSFGAHVLRTVYAEVWGRENLSMREKRLMVLGALAAQALEWPLKTHLTCALQNGEISRDDIEEFRYLLAAYIGQPKATVFAQIAEAAVSDAAEKV